QALACMDVDVIAIQEPPRAHSCRRLLSESATQDWALVVGKSPSRSAILLRKHISYTAIEGMSNLSDWSGVDIACGGKAETTTRILSGYCPSDGRITMEQCLDGVSQHVRGRRVLLCCDSNAWNNAWGSPPDGGSYQRRRGYVLEEWATGLDLHLLNDPDSPPTFRSHRTTLNNAAITSHIDVTFCSEALTRRLIHWRVNWDHPLSMISDHAAILLVLSAIPSAPVVPPWHNKGFFDADRFAEEVSGYFSDIREIDFSALHWDQVESVTETVSGKLKKLVEACRRPPRIPAGKPAWWTRELASLDDRVKWLRRRVKRTNGSSLVRAELRAACRDLKRLRRQTIDSHARKVISKITDPQDAFAFHKRWRDANAGYTHTYHSATYVAEALFPDEEDDLPEQATARASLHDRLSYFRSQISTSPPVELRELLDLLRDVRTKSCPGEDAVPIAAVKMTIEREPSFFCSLFSSFFRHRRIPAILKKGY
ncbi:hypothetical protein FOZ60_004211, partial [Perkinsus olseni]